MTVYNFLSNNNNFHLQNAHKKNKGLSNKHEPKLNFEIEWKSIFSALWIDRFRSGFIPSRLVSIVVKNFRFLPSPTKVSHRPRLTTDLSFLLFYKARNILKESLLFLTSDKHENLAIDNIFKICGRININIFIIYTTNSSTPKLSIFEKNKSEIRVELGRAGVCRRSTCRNPTLIIAQNSKQKTLLADLTG